MIPDLRYCMNCQKETPHRHYSISPNDIILKCDICNQEEKAVKIKEIPERSHYPGKPIQVDRIEVDKELTLSETLKRLRQDKK